MVATTSKSFEWFKIINYIAFIASIIILFCILVFSYIIYNPSTTIRFADPNSSQNSQYDLYTLDELSQYNGTNSDLPILMAVDGKVYDVTDGSRFYSAGNHYSYLAGTDATKPLQIVGTEIITNKYPQVGLLVESK